MAPVRLAYAMAKRRAPKWIWRDAAQEGLLYLLDRYKNGAYKRRQNATFESWAYLEIRTGIGNFLRTERVRDFTVPIPCWYDPPGESWNSRYSPVDLVLDLEGWNPVATTGRKSTLTQRAYEGLRSGVKPVEFARQNGLPETATILSYQRMIIRIRSHLWTQC